MQMKAYRYRLYPTKDQEQVLIGWLGQLRFIWNKLLEDNIKQYEENKTFSFRYEMKRRLPQMKKDMPWLDAPAHAMQNKVFDLDKALRRCVVDKISKFPRFKSKRSDRSGIKIDQTNSGHIRLEGRHIVIPKLGRVRYVRHREPQGRLTSITIKRDADHWYVSCLHEIGEDVSPRTEFAEDEVVGIDLGILNLAITSDGEIIENPRFLKKALKRLRRRQRQLSRAKKGSKNREKKKLKVARLYRRVRNQRKDYFHKKASAIAKHYRVVCMEDLNVKGMLKNRCLSRSIADASWDLFVNILKDKLAACGGLLVKIDRFAPSSKACSSCGHIQDMPLSQRKFLCTDCGVELDRDLNAAINIRSFGIERLIRAGTARIYACGVTAIGDQTMDWSRYVTEKQETAITSGSQ